MGWNGCGSAERRCYSPRSVWRGVQQWGRVFASCLLWADQLVSVGVIPCPSPLSQEFRAVGRWSRRLTGSARDTAQRLSELLRCKGTTTFSYRNYLVS